MADLARLSLNQMTVRSLRVSQVAELCRRHGIAQVGLWREPVAQTGVKESARVIQDAGLHVSSLCRGGFFPAETEAGRRERLDDNRRAVEEAAELGADTLVLVCGGIPGHDLEAARRMVADAVHQLTHFARAHGVRLGVEPLHPMYAATRSVVNTVAQALAIVADLPESQVGVVLDVYHVWWDPDLYRQIEQARGRIFGFHVCDWLDPLPDVLNGRGMMGDGFCDIPRIRHAVEQAGYAGPIEVEIFNDQIWAMPPDELIALMKERFQTSV